MRATPPTAWLAEHRIDGALVARIGRRDGALVAEFPSIGTVVAEAGEAAPRFEPAKGADPAAVKKLSTGLMAALARHIAGKITLHAGAAGKNGNAVAFIGRAGAGKSTLAAALCAGPAGAELVADDTVALELPSNGDRAAPIEVVPTEGAAWLFSDARLALGLDSSQLLKVPVPLSQPSRTTFSLRALVGLEFDPAISSPILRRIKGREAFSLIVGSLIRFVVDDPDAQLREFDQVRRLVETCDIFELRRPRDLQMLATTAEMMRTLLLGGPEGEVDA